MNLAFVAPLALMVGIGLCSFRKVKNQSRGDGAAKENNKERCTKQSGGLKRDFQIAVGASRERRHAGRRDLRPLTISV
jgi:hypothetical protein